MDNYKKHVFSSSEIALHALFNVCDLYLNSSTTWNCEGIGQEQPFIHSFIQQCILHLIIDQALCQVQEIQQ